MKRCLLFIVLTAYGCYGDTESWMPLNLGAKASYVEASGLGSQMVDVTIERAGPVGPVPGYRIAGSGSETLVGWSSGRLLASALGGIRFEPPVPLLGSPKDSWKGNVRWLGKAAEAEAGLVTAETTGIVFGRKQALKQSVLTIRTGTESVQVTTWFAQGVGIWRQEVRRSDRLVSRIELVRSD